MDKVSGVLSRFYKDMQDSWSIPGIDKAYVSAHRSLLTLLIKQLEKEVYTKENKFFPGRKGFEPEELEHNGTVQSCINAVKEVFGE